jgi:hypothetical protein
MGSLSASRVSRDYDDSHNLHGTGRRQQRINAYSQVAPGIPLEQTGLSPHPLGGIRRECRDRNASCHRLSDQTYNPVFYIKVALIALAVWLFYRSARRFAFLGRAELTSRRSARYRFARFMDLPHHRGRLPVRTNEMPASRQ